MEDGADVSEVHGIFAHFTFGSDLMLSFYTLKYYSILAPCVQGVEDTLFYSATMLDTL